MAERLTEKEIDEYRSAFKIFDKNGDDRISTAELEEVLRSLGQNPSEKVIQEMIEHFDADGNGTIEFHEFLSIMVKRMEEMHTEEDMIEAFKLFDKDSNGYITSSELKHVMETLGENLTETELDDMIREADTDSDGRVNYDEFVRMMTKKE